MNQNKRNRYLISVLKPEENFLQGTFVVNLPPINSQHKVFCCFYIILRYEAVKESPYKVLSSVRYKEKICKHSPV